MAATTGYDGCITICAGTVAHIRAGTVRITQEAHDITNCAHTDGYRHYLCGIHDWTLDWEGFADCGASWIATNLGGCTCAFSFAPCTAESLTGTGITTSLEVSWSKDGVVEIRGSVQGTGVPTVT